MCSYSLGVTILELACNIEVPNGGNGWQQLRQGSLPSEFTSSKSPLLGCCFVNMLLLVCALIIVFCVFCRSVW